MWPLWASTSLYTAFILCTASIPLMYLDSEGDSQKIYLGVAIPVLTLVCAFVNYMLVSRPLNKLLIRVEMTLEQRNVTEGHQRNVLKRTKDQLEGEDPGIKGPQTSLHFGMINQQRLIDELGVSSYHSEMYHLQAHVKDLFQSLIREQQALYKLQVETIHSTAATGKENASHHRREMSGRAPSDTERNGVRRQNSALPTLRGGSNLISPIPKTTHDDTSPPPKEDVVIRRRTRAVGSPAPEVPPPGTFYLGNQGAEPPQEKQQQQQQRATVVIEESPVTESMFNDLQSCGSSQAGGAEYDRGALSSTLRREGTSPQSDSLTTIPEQQLKSIMVRRDLLEVLSPGPQSVQQHQDPGSLSTSGMRSPSQIVPSPPTPHSKDQLASLGVTTPLILDRGDRFKGDRLDHCMYMCRFNSGNLVLYRGRVEQPMADSLIPALNLEDPLETYWLKLDPARIEKHRAAGKMDDRTELTYLEDFPYGTKVERQAAGAVAGTSWKVAFNALKKRPVVLQMEKILLMDNTGNYGTGSVVDVPVATFIPTMRLKLEGVECILEKIYVHAVDRKWTPVPKVEYIELHGWSVDTGDKVMEVVKP